MATSPGMARLQAETVLREGAVPESLPDALTVTRTYEISRDAFLLRLPMGLAFHYRRGAGTIYACAASVSDKEVSLFFDGSVYGAIAWLNGLVPLHASAVSHAGGVYAFTGVSGEGKSTLAAALARRGLTVCSDDVLVLDLTEPGEVMAVPGHRRLKLWADALALTDRRSDDAVRPGIDKFYVADQIPFDAQPLPIRRLYMLQSVVNADPGIGPIIGADRFAALRSAYYRPQFCSAIADQADYFATASRLSSAITISRFNRSRDTTDFAAGISMIEADIRGTHG
ncbi:hypothetical protein NDN01_07590 [Sphingomonas sp. QA11]|uniref:hypothetical protein n=1 Tax=Sphingomonas sp. QA11 TaxID=2950605 RepID=UPI002348F54C|nr:hypothetical protein [Sphingomonas sp. QA11]WCM28759.1 hypothetical protein NDN01_07590 [Sphingomonas sp. QA11]